MILDDEIDALYAVAPAEFLEARKALAVRAKKAGDKDGAALVAKIPKPTPAAWAVNQLHRTAKRELDALLAIGATLRDAHRKGPGGVRDLFAAQQAQRAAIDAMTRTARGLLERAGVPASETTLARVGDTLTSISTLNRWDGAVPGRLSRELPPPGFDALLEVLGEAGPPAPARPLRAVKAPPEKAPEAKAPAPPPKRSEEALEERRKAAADARREAEARVTEAQRDAERAEARVRATHRAADESGQKAKDAETRARRLAEVAKAAETALARAKHEASEAAKDASAAIDRAESARTSADEARRANDAAAANLSEAKDRLEAARRAEAAIVKRAPR
ncbi:hypothetical protein [Pendulispora albinea]|uniref:TolA protein n=1 Tax=Pendulispora albinea TaxID=2741071 RepID=A0ABZ2M1J3_9BACT